MSKQTRISFFALITLLTLLANLIFPVSVLADDEVPPPAPIEETTPPEESEADTPPQDSTVEPAPVSEILEQLPEDTELVVLDENGEALPLVTQQAEQIIIAGDPMWCPEGQLPGGSGCTPPFSDFNSGTGLLQFLTNNNAIYTGNGTIFIAYDYNPSTAGDGNIILSGTDLQGGGVNANLGNLTIQGGWDFGNNIANGQTNFGANYLNVVNWNGNVTINNIFIDGASAFAIIVEANGDINLNNVTANNSVYGATVDNCAVVGSNCTGTGDIVITNSQFNGNDSGIEAISAGDITLNNVIVNGNDASGAYLDTAYGAGDIVITNSQFNGNFNYGIGAYSAGGFTLNNVIANGNDGDGAILASIGDIVITNSQFNGNDYGIGAVSAGDITLNNVIANGNDATGAYLGNNNGTGDIVITNSQFNGNNYGIGADSAGDITLNNVIANGNDYDGAYLDNTYGTDKVFITNSQFNNNGGDGLDVYSAGSITLNSVTASGNFYSGAILENCGCAGIVGITITGNNVFTNNGLVGLEAYSDGAVNIENVTANGNGFAGMVFDSDSATIQNSQFNNNGLGGMGGNAMGDITITNVVVSGNQFGLGFATSGDVNIKCSIITNNSLEGVGVDASNLNLIGSTITNNGVDYLNGSGPVNIFDYDCNPSITNPNKPNNNGTGLPLNVVFGNSADLDCELYSGTVLILPNGDKVTFKCPIDGSATLNRVTNDGLPNELPEGIEYVSGLVATQNPDGSDVALDGLVVISFVIPDDLKGADLSILYWDGTEWIDLDKATFDDGRSVYNGGYVTEDGYFEAFTNFTGNFVLVTN